VADFPRAVRRDVRHQTHTLSTPTLISHLVTLMIGAASLLISRIGAVPIEPWQKKR
jgi:hypothetical protein